MNDPRPDIIRSEVEFLAYLDALGIPHAKTSKAIRERYGVERSKYYSWDVIAIKDAKPFLSGQVGDIQFNEHFDSDLLPPEMFQAFLSLDENARENHNKVLMELEKIFGEPSSETSVSNTVSHHWRFGHAVLDITTWPPDVNKFENNEAHSKHPELRAYVHLSIRPGHLLQLSAQETAWLEAFEPFEFPEGTIIAAVMRDANGVNAGILRWHQGLETSTEVGLSQDGKALVGIFPTISMVLNLSHVTGVELLQIGAARAEGYSKLYIDYQDVYSSQKLPRRYTLAHGHEEHSLDKFAESVAEKLNLKLKIETGLND